MEDFSMKKKATRGSRAGKKQSEKRRSENMVEQLVADGTSDGSIRRCCDGCNRPCASEGLDSSSDALSDKPVIPREDTPRTED